ncbi:MAG: response regulator transcription factor [Cyanobacteria bacterium KgW148]|nr:response regulator transcription factor [Cyanobacteria bacterium KgW148]
MRLLLIDDEVELTAPLQQFLQQQGYGVEVANSSTEGWQLLSQNRYNLVILDWIMPGASGLELCQRLRLFDRSTPILFLTAKDTLNDRVEGLEMGADDYLVKPFELRELLARVRALLRRGGFSCVPGDRLTFADLVLDCPNQTMTRGQRSVHLSDKEFQLLYFFLQYPDRLISHEELIDYLWGKESPPNSNALVAQIKLLRRKVDGNLEPPLIHTIYGKGYRFSLTN